MVNHNLQSQSVIIFHLLCLMPKLKYMLYQDKELVFRVSWYFQVQAKY